ncbi:hypothetical protein ACROYT_G028001 [Oculina patagonica]
MCNTEVERNEQQTCIKINIGVVSVLKYAAVGMVIFLQSALTYVLSEKNLSILTCCILICCYLWSSYRSFAQKYQDLAVKLFEEYDQLTDSAIPPCNTDLNMQGFTSDYGRTIDNVKRIPKELFEMACEKLMPIGKAFCQIPQATNVNETVWSSSNRTTLNGFSEQEIKCGWRCEVNVSDLSTSIKTAFSTGKIVIYLRFDYLKKVDKKCVNQLLNNSSREESERRNSVYWKIWLVNNKLPTSANSAAVRRLLSFLAFNKTYKYLTTNNCTLDLKSTHIQEDYDELSPRDYFENILRLTVATMGELCNTEVERNEQQTCIKITESVPSFSGWVFCILDLLFMIFFTYFAPTVVCLYSATEDTHEGIRKITVEGPSPVGFRSLIGNYFFSTDHTMWHMARKFIMRVFILPIPFLVPAIFFKYLLCQTALSSKTNVREETYLFKPFWLLLSSPIATLCIYANFSLWQLVDFHSCHRYLLFAVRLVAVVLDICMSCLAAIGVVSVLKYSAVGIVIFLHVSLPYVLSGKNLPFLSCCVLVSYYLWYNYRSFTQKYQDLALKLFEEYNQLMESACNTDLNMEGFTTSDYGHTIDEHVKRIPKELFDMACEELMPIGKSIFRMALKATLSIIFVWTAYSLTMLLNVSPVTKILMTFVTGSFPKIVTILVERKRKRKLKPFPINEKTRKIVHESTSALASLIMKAINVSLFFQRKTNRKENVASIHLHFALSLLPLISVFMIFRRSIFIQQTDMLAV